MPSSIFRDRDPACLGTTDTDRKLLFVASHVLDASRLKASAKDLEFVIQLVEAGRVRVVIDR